MKIKNKIKSKGFTLIETMISLTVLGALSAIAIPAYQDYVIRSQVSEAFIGAEGLKKEVENQKALSDRFDINLVKIDSQTIKVDEDGNVSYIFKNKNKEINEKLVMFILDDNNNGAFRWDCVTNINPKYLPSSSKCIVDEDSIDNTNPTSPSENKQKMSANFYLDDIIINIFTYENGDIEISSERGGEILDKLLFSKDTKKTSYIDYKDPTKNLEKEFNYDEIINESNKYSSKFYSDDLKYFISDILEFDILDPESENYISR